MRANQFTVIEEWQTAKAIEKHATATHTKEYRNSLAPIAGSPLDERLYKAVE
jgi:quinol monooxygenase YgiN